MNKSIIILGSAGSGKSHFEEELYKWTDFQEPRMFNRLNPDDWVENENHEFYNNPLGASNYLYKTVIPNIMEIPMDFILQNTGSNQKTLRKIIDTPNYQFKAVVVYCNPIIAFLRNFSRERKLPKQVLLENWLKVYSQIKDYQDMFGIDNIYVYETEYTQEEEQLIYENNFFSTPSTVINFLETKNDYTSSFKKESTIYTPKQEELRSERWNLLLDKIDKNLSKLYIPVDDNKEDANYIKEELNKWIT
jgi:adenylate kinase family enzyme